MIPPRRLLEEGSPFEREVLESAQLDVGRDAGLKRTLAAIGVGAATLSAAASTASAGAAMSSSAGTAAATTVGVLGRAGAGVLVKWIGLALIVGGTATAAAVASLIPAARPRAIPIASQPAVTGVTGAPVPMARGESMAASPPLPSVAQDSPAWTAPKSDDPHLSLPSASRTSIAVAPGRTAPPQSHVSARDPDLNAPKDAVSLPVASGAPLAMTPPVPVVSPSTLDAEIAALDQVRAALARRDARIALNQLDAYDRMFPSSALADESTVLRVDALIQQGDLAAATTLGRRFLTENPSSPHVPHVRSVIDGAHNP